MPDKAYTVPGTGETIYRHVTSSQQRLMSKLKWERTVQRARAAKCEAPKLEHPPLRSLSEVQAEREQRDLQMKLDNPAGHRLDLYPIWKCPCGALNQYADTFGEICSRCGTDHTLDWQKFICEIGLSSSRLDNPAYSAPVPDGLERICGAFATAKGEACPLPMFHEGDCPVDED